jgi:pimeloyl-ACP methyl ester carboxylesterase
MNKLLAGIASVLSGVALLLATQTQTFSRVDAAGPKLRMLIAGSGSPAVVFETGGDAPLELWGSVTSEVSKFAKTISYDRAGNGLSNKATAPRDGRHIATELHTALHNANAAPPYILVGHSIGGPYIRVFAGMYPDEVAGMVLIDPTQEEMIAWDKDHGFEQSGLNECGPDSERGCAVATLAHAHESHIPANIPVFLIHIMWPPATLSLWSVEKQESSEMKIQMMRAPLSLKFHKEWVEKIPGGQLIVTDKSFHGTINLEEPELVIRTIRQAIEKARAVNTLAETK